MGNINAPHDRRHGDPQCRSTRLHRKKDTTSTVEHVEQMLRELAQWLPDRDLHLSADGAYASVAGADVPRTHITSRMRRDAAIHQLAPPPTGKPGRPRTKGDRLPTPPQLADQVGKRQWHKATINMRSRPVTRLIHTRDALWHKVNPRKLVRLVIVRDPDGVEPDDFFFTTDLTATGAKTATRYAERWSIESCFRDAKQNPGGEDPQSWKRKGPERAACLYPCCVWQVLSALVPPQGHPQLPRRPRRTTPRPVDPPNYSYVRINTRRRQNHQRHAGHPCLRHIAQTQSAKLHGA
jgi:hypothetical protein